MPQYQKAVIKARFAEAKINLKILAQAQQACRLEQDPSTCDLPKLDINLGEDGSKYGAPDWLRFTDNFIYDIWGNWASAGYRKDHVCLIYKIDSQELVLGTQVCPNDRLGEEPLYDYESLLGLSTDTSFECC